MPRQEQRSLHQGITVSLNAIVKEPFRATEENVLQSIALFFWMRDMTSD
jgi:hypothetical protein